MMTVAEYIVDELEKNNVTDAFGVPGGVVLKLLYAMKEKGPKLVPHLNYHEQMAGFAACGYAQVKQSLGVAYATRGPGVTNLITCIAEAYQEALPVLFITAHGHRDDSLNKNRSSQELELASVLGRFTKYSDNVESVNEVAEKLKKACQIALEGRKGPVFLDFATELFSKQMAEPSVSMGDSIIIDNAEYAIECIKTLLSQAQQPVILIGNGVRGVEVTDILNSINIPVLSSRFSQDIVSQCRLYFGYIGSHASRYSNFILSKTDAIICIGNSMTFPYNSLSFSPIVNRAKIIRIDIDENEFRKKFPHCTNVLCDAENLFRKLSSANLGYSGEKKWIEKCREIKKSLNDYDIVNPVEELIYLLGAVNDDVLFVCDIGNNEFWFSRAFEYARPKGQILYSKFYGTLGSALGRAIGAFYAIHKKVICIIGDQGMQYNIQELQYIAHWKLPIKIILMNNACSGMIFDHEHVMFGEEYVHVTCENGYSVPNFEKVSEVYGINYYNSRDCRSMMTDILQNDEPAIYEINYSGNIRLVPSVPKGNPCQLMTPLIDKKLQDYLESL